MSIRTFLFVAAWGATSLVPQGLTGRHAMVLQAASSPRATLRSASPLSLPGDVDSNSPALWSLDPDRPGFFVMTSFGGQPRLSTGPSLTQLGGAEIVASSPDHGVWMEALVQDRVGTWYGYYHQELSAAMCGRPDRFVVRIGAARSTDLGRTWEDLGIILEAGLDTVACSSLNRYVLGGVGDVSVMLDPTETDLYFFFSQYPKAQAGQGVAVGRLLWADRDAPVGAVAVWQDGLWQYGRFVDAPITDADGATRSSYWEYPEGTPLVPTTEPWHDGDNKVNAFWGPSVHWNTFLEQYVMLLSRAKDENYGEEGMYVSFAPRLDDPGLWSPPQKILDGGRWYPQVMGLEAGSGTDKTAGATARFFMSGRSEYTITFSR